MEQSIERREELYEVIGQFARLAQLIQMKMNLIAPEQVKQLQQIANQMRIHEEVLEAV